MTLFTTYRVWLGSLAMIAIVTITGQPAAGQPFGRGPAGREMRGVVRSVDAPAGTITVTVGDGRQGGAGAAAEKTFAVDKNAEVALGDGSGRRLLLKEGKLADLAAGTSVALSLTDDEQTVKTILAQGPQVRGTLKSIDTAQRQIVVTLAPTQREQAAEEKSYALSPQVEVGVDDGRGRRFSIKEGKVTDLVAGAPVTLQVSGDQKEVLSVVVEGPTVSGTVKSLTTGGNSMTITVGGFGGRETAEERTIHVADDAVVLIDDGKGRLLSLKEGQRADIPCGAMVRVKLSPDQKAAAQIIAEGPILAAVIRNVDAAKRVITVAFGFARGAAPEEKSFPVAEDARIVINNQTAGLGDIQVADNGPFAMLRLSLNQQQVQGIIINPGR